MRDDDPIPCRLAAGTDPVTELPAAFWRRAGMVYLLPGTDPLPPAGEPLGAGLAMPDATWAANRRLGAWPWAVDV